MQLLVIAEARDTLVGDAVRRLREDVRKAVQRIAASGKLRAGGILAGKRSAFLLLEVDSAEELMDLLGTEVIDNMQCSVQPVLSFESLAEFFAEHPV